MKEETTGKKVGKETKADKVGNREMLDGEEMTLEIVDVIIGTAPVANMTTSIEIGHARSAMNLDNGIGILDVLGKERVVTEAVTEVEVAAG